MNIFANKRNGSAAFQLNPVAAGCAVFLSMMAGSVYAQEAAQATEAAKAADVKAEKTDPNAPVVPSVTVAGIRRGIEAAISDQKNSNRSLKRFRPKTSANCLTPAWLNRSPACQALPHSVAAVRARRRHQRARSGAQLQRHPGQRSRASIDRQRTQP
jgi:hypothetical protein